MLKSLMYSFLQFTVPQSCPTLCDPMDCSTPGFPVHHQLLELTQTHGHWVGDPIQASHPLLSPPPALNLSQHQGLFQCQFFASGGHSIRVSASTSVLPMNTQDSSPLRWTGWISLQFKGLSRVFSNNTVRSIDSLALSFLYSPTLISIQFSSFQLLSHVQLFATPWIIACQASLSITNSWSLPRLTCIKLVMPSSISSSVVPFSSCP